MWFANYLSTALALTSLVAPSLAAELTKVPSFGPNPRNVTMYIYVPNKLAAKPPVLVVPHWCHGTAQDAFRGRPYSSLADTYGFIVIFPDSPNKADQCWDVSSPQSLTHDGGGDALGIASMVRWTLEKHNGDKDRVFVTGTSSGAMMTNVLLGSYPDLFAAGSAFAGVPFGCYAANGYGVWSDDCAKGKIVKTGKEWADMVYAAYPEYKGYRPKLQVWHGTADQVLEFTNFKEEIKQWTTVLGLNSTASVATADTPLKGWTRYRYGGGVFEAYEAKGVSHDIPNQADPVMEFFDLRCTTGKCFSRPKN